MISEVTNLASRYLGNSCAKLMYCLVQLNEFCFKKASNGIFSNCELFQNLFIVQAADVFTSKGKLP